MQSSTTILKLSCIWDLLVRVENPGHCGSLYFSAAFIISVLQYSVFQQESKIEVVGYLFNLGKKSAAKNIRRFLLAAQIFLKLKFLSSLVSQFNVCIFNSELWQYHKFDFDEEFKLSKCKVLYSMYW